MTGDSPRANPTFGSCVKNVSSSASGVRGVMTSNGRWESVVEEDEEARRVAKRVMWLGAMDSPWVVREARRIDQRWSEGQT